MLEGNDFITSSGVILSRKEMGENSLWVTLFLRDVGIINATARHAGGDTEPFVWGVFNLKRKTKSRSYFIDDIEIKDDMLPLRGRGESILAALKWSKLLMKYLIAGQPDNELQTNLYWNMKLLPEKKIPVDALNWRFLWHWLEIWGLAPDLFSFHKAMKFNDDEIFLLAQITQLNTQGMIQLFNQPLRPNIREKMFKVAVKFAENFLNEK